MNSVKHLRTTLAVTLFCTFAAQSALACKSPAAPKSIPDGRRSEIQTMLESKRQVETYFVRVSDYMSCENDALKLQEAKARQQEVLKQFNAEVRAYKIANSPMVAARH
ncbi:MAG: hypothetical protein ABW278_03680 [Steroidobacteraceae bacterium]